ncbi:MAG TPA: aminotransferase class III-fold pyridoxal phosphate-dependent enzyme, partial [Fimbriimonadaceae bacterium]|nr:aminotransferase class III-fold pyridoxal phosphate-dependent enzyme [Fimbriimonadaceae bacterium]
GNPLAMAAGLAALSQLDDAAYDSFEKKGARLVTGLNEAAKTAGVTAQVQRVGAMLSVYFTEHPVTDFAEAQTTDKSFFGKLFHALLKRGIYLPPSALEAWFLTLSHSDDDIDRTVEQFGAALQEASAR